MDPGSVTLSNKSEAIASVFGEYLAALEEKGRADARLEKARARLQKSIPKNILEEMLKHLGNGTEVELLFCDRPYKGDHGIVRCKRPAGHSGKHGQGKRTKTRGHAGSKDERKILCNEPMMNPKKPGDKRTCTRHLGHKGKHWVGRPRKTAT